VSSACRSNWNDWKPHPAPLDQTQVTALQQVISEAQSDNAAIAAIRQAGANQEVLVPGSDWTGAWSWLSSGNAAAINPSTIHDPDNNWAIEVHQYLDSNGSGTNFSPITDPNIGVERLSDITNWAQQNGVKLFLGETGVPGDGQSLTALQNMLSYMEQNASVWQGAAYWAGGPWWGSYLVH
jgi:endoglucanase